MDKWLNALVVIKGISKKGKPYEMLGVSKDNKFNRLVIQDAKQSGVREIDLTQAAQPTE